MSRAQKGERAAYTGDRNRRPRGVIYRDASGTREVEVALVLSKWAVTVRDLTADKILADDYFNDRWQAVARAEDFLRLLNNPRPPHGWRPQAGGAGPGAAEA